ncbi:MAG: putative TDP-glycosamine N-acetyltransferase [Myxococcales bacterium]|nr:putative TDP-glycosamine N-acetyltransferase [Myxococcales bacterium]
MTIHDSPFDSAHYELTIGKLEIGSGEELEPSILEARARQLDVVFLRVSEANSSVTSALAERGLAPLETLVTSTLGTAPAPSVLTNPAIAISHHDTLSPNEAAIIGEITAEAITGTHLHADPRLPVGRTNRLYAAWGRNDALGRAHKTILARAAGEIVGYIAVLLSDRVAVIDLVAVKATWRGSRVGSALLQSFIEWVRGAELDARVGTQSDNPALGLYRRFGFIPSERQSTYHLWL